MPETPTSNKKKLTLSVDEKVVEKAKSLGINLSDVTEAVLRGFAFAPDQTENDAMYEKYKELCDSMLPLLKEYNTSVTIAEDPVYDKDGDYMQSDEVSLLSDGTFWSYLFDTSFTDIKKISVRGFLEPKQILSNFITAIASSKEKRKEQLEELEMAKRIIYALTETTRIHPHQRAALNYMKRHEAQGSSETP